MWSGMFGEKWSLVSTLEWKKSVSIGDKILYIENLKKSTNTIRIDKWVWQCCRIHIIEGDNFYFYTCNEQSKMELGKESNLQ